MRMFRLLKLVRLVRVLVKMRTLKRIMAEVNGCAWHCTRAPCRVTTEYLGTPVIMSMITDFGDDYEYTILAPPPPPRPSAPAWQRASCD